MTNSKYKNEWMLSARFLLKVYSLKKLIRYVKIYTNISERSVYMRNKILVAASVVLFIAFALINMSSVIVGLGVGNFIVSLLFIIFWGAMIKFTAEGKGIMVYSISLWSVILLSSLISLIAASAQVSVGFLMVPAAFFTAPLFGFRTFIASSVASYSILLAISAAFVGGSVYSLVKKAI